MSDNKDLGALIAGMKPVLNRGQYVYCCVDSLETIPADKIVFSFREQEGLTALLLREEADALGLEYSYIAAWITLTVESSLEAVGFTAFFSGLLASHGIGCNTVAGFHHDHLFVPFRSAAQAMQLLESRTVG